LLGDGRGGFHLAHGSPVGDPQPRIEPQLRLRTSVP
jgi:hypothetical protein